MLSANCEICGAPCKQWGDDSYWCCSSCSKKVMAIQHPGRGVDSYNPKDGDGFPKSHWKDSFEKVKFQMSKPPIGHKEARKNLAQDIINALKDHMYPYGGYVRDHMAGDDFKDLDLFFPRYDTRWASNNKYHDLSSMVSKLKAAGFNLVKVPSAKKAYSPDNNEVELTKLRYSVTHPDHDAVIEIDLVKSSAWEAKNDHPYPSLDADVNSLALDNYGLLWAVTGLPLEEVLNHIRNRVFNIPGDSTLKGERVNKLLEKGYKVLISGIDVSTLKEGDLVRVRIENRGVSYWRAATVLEAGTFNKAATVALDEPISTIDYSSYILDQNHKTIAQKWGVQNLNQPIQWQVGGSEARYTVVEEIIQRVADRPRLKLEQALPGTRVRCVNSSYKEYIGKFAKVVKASAYSIDVEWEDGTVENTDFSYLDSFQFIEAAPPAVFKQGSINASLDALKTTHYKPEEAEEAVEMKKHKVAFEKLQEGDVVELIVDDPSEEYNDDTDEYELLGERTITGTFLRINEDGDAVFILDEHYGSDELASMSPYDLNEGDIDRYIARKYGADNVEEDVYWTVEKTSSETTINKVIKHQNPQSPTKKEETQNNMSNGIDWKAVIIEDAGKATIRTGANLGIDGLKAGLEKVLQHEGVDGPGAQAVMKFFNGPFGEALLRAGLGYTLLGLPIPFIQENEYAQKVSEELRVSGLSKGMDKGAEMVKQFIVPSLLQAFQGTPLLENIMNGAKKEETVKPRIAESAAPARIATPAAPIAEEGEIDVEFEETARAGARAAL